MRVRLKMRLNSSNERERGRELHRRALSAFADFITASTEKEREKRDTHRKTQTQTEKRVLCVTSRERMREW